MKQYFYQHTKDIHTLSEFQGIISAHDIEQCISDDSFDFSRIFDKLFLNEKNSITPFSKEHHRLSRKINAIVLNNFLSDIYEKINNYSPEPNDSENDYIKYYIQINSLYKSYMYSFRVYSLQIQPEEEKLFNTILNFLDIKSSLLFAYNQSFATFHSFINKAISTMGDNLSEDYENSEILSELNMCSDILKKIFDKRMFIDTHPLHNHKINDFILHLQQFEVFQNFSTIATYIDEQTSDLKQLCSSINMLDDLEICHQEIEGNDKQIRSIISFPHNTTNFKRLYLDIFINLKKFLKPAKENTSFSYQYKPYTNEIPYRISIENCGTNSNSTKKINIIIDCEKNFSPYFSEFMFQKIITLKTIFYGFHSDSLGEKALAFKKFCLDLMKEERELYLNYVLDNSNNHNPDRVKSKI